MVLARLLGSRFASMGVADEEILTIECATMRWESWNNRMDSALTSAEKRKSTGHLSPGLFVLGTCCDFYSFADKFSSYFSTICLLFHRCCRLFSRRLLSRAYHVCPGNYEPLFFCIVRFSSTVSWRMNMQVIKRPFSSEIYCAARLCEPVVWATVDKV